MLRNMTYECDKENVTSVKDKILDRTEFHEISIGSDLWDDIFNGCLHAWIQIFSGEKEKDNGEGGGRAFISYNLVYNVI